MTGGALHQFGCGRIRLDRLDIRDQVGIGDAQPILHQGPHRHVDLAQALVTLLQAEHGLLRSGVRLSGAGITALEIAGRLPDTPICAPQDATHLPIRECRCARLLVFVAVPVYPACTE